MKSFNKGFTLIELLVVIAILGIIMAAVIAAINPLDKINAANDSTVQADIAQIATAHEAYATQNNGVYAANQAALKTAGELKNTFTPPTGYAFTEGTLGGGVSITAPLKSNKYVKAVPSTPFWTWCSSTGKAGPVANNTTCP